MPEKITPVPGDPSTEPVATAEQSHVDGRVGPPTIAQDTEADYFAPEGATQIEPGTVLPASTPWEGGLVGAEEAPYSVTPDGQDLQVHADAVPGDDEPQAQTSGPVKSDADKATRKGR